MRSPLTVIIFLLSLTSLLAQKKDDAYYHFTQMFDTTLTDSLFKKHYDQFYTKAYSKYDTSKQWHRGQTDYNETFYTSGFHQFNSTTYFNSMRSELYVQQLCYNNKVVFKTEYGGERMINQEYGSLYALPDIDTLKLQSYSDTLYSPMTFYNHDLKKIVHFNIVTVQSYRNRSQLDIQIVGHSEYVGIHDRWYEDMTEDNTPHIFIENH